MLTELIFNVLFLIPYTIIAMLPNIPVYELGSLLGFVELLTIANAFFPVGLLLKFVAVWIALGFLSLMKFFVDWLLSIIPFY